ncbi:CGA synthase-related protein [Streptomyces sp. x-80]|uniref:CGA synthase-related protein n=1 Tax=Streptomyces sp. x-80 TaxID=2789282 RepID=UPI00397F2633
MAVLSAPSPNGPVRQRVLLVDDARQLDSLTARRRVAAHLAELELVHGEEGAAPEGPCPDAALVCDVPRAARELAERDVPVVYLHSGHTTAELPVTTAAIRQVHVPAWLPGPKPVSREGAQPTGVLAPGRLGRDRKRSGSLLLFSAYGVSGGAAEVYAELTLRPLAEEAVRRTGRCDVVYDTGAEGVREALAPVEGVRVHLAREVDADALHASAEVFLASPTLTAVSLAQARRAPLTFLPALGPGQEDLARRTGQVVPVGTVGDPTEPGLWPPYGQGTRSPWSAVDPAVDDLRGAQRVARRVRQLALAPTGF